MIVSNELNRAGLVNRVACRNISSDIKSNEQLILINASYSLAFAHSCLWYVGTTLNMGGASRKCVFRSYPLILSSL